MSFEQFLFELDRVGVSIQTWNTVVMSFKAKLRSDAKGLCR